MSKVEDKTVDTISTTNSMKPQKPKKKSKNFSKLSNMRIIQKQLVYVIGLSQDYAFKEVKLNNIQDLSNFEYFGQYGKILKLVVNKNKVYNANGPNGPSYSAYVTFSNSKESSIAILSLDNATVDNHLIRASYGTTK